MNMPVGANQQREQQAHSDSQKLANGEESHFRIWQDRASPFSYKVMSYPE
jgi:hypothetical protein